MAENEPNRPDVKFVGDPKAIKDWVNATMAEFDKKFDKVAAAAKTKFDFSTKEMWTADKKVFFEDAKTRSDAMADVLKQLVEKVDALAVKVDAIAAHIMPKDRKE